MSLDLAPSLSTATAQPATAVVRAPDAGPVPVASRISAASPTPGRAARVSWAARARRRLARLWAAVSDPSPVGRTGPDPRHEAARRDALWARDERLLR